jgi:hypothetical protein
MARQANGWHSLKIIEESVSLLAQTVIERPGCCLECKCRAFATPGVWILCTDETIRDWREREREMWAQHLGRMEGVLLRLRIKKELVAKKERRI